MCHVQTTKISFIFAYICKKQKKKAKNEEYLEGETARRMSLKCYKVYREVESDIFSGSWLWFILNLEQFGEIHLSPQKVQKTPPILKEGCEMVTNYVQHKLKLLLLLTLSFFLFLFLLLFCVRRFKQPLPATPLLFFRGASNKSTETEVAMEMEMRRRMKRSRKRCKKTSEQRWRWKITKMLALVTHRTT